MVSTFAPSSYSPCLYHFLCMFPSSLCPVTSESRISWRNWHHIEKIPAWLLRRLQNAGVVQSDNKKIECITLCITKQINHLHHYHCNIVITAGFCPTNTGRFSGLLGGKQFFSPCSRRQLWALTWRYGLGSSSVLFGHQDPSSLFSRPWDGA